MKRLLRQYGYFWSTMTQDCIDYAKGCKLCQKHGPIQYVPMSISKSIVKPWSIRGWDTNIIGKINHLSSKKHSFSFVAISCSMKWVEVASYKNIN